MGENIFPYPQDEVRKWSPIIRMSSLLLRRYFFGDRPRIVVEDRRQPSLRLLDRPALAPRVVLDLVALDLADTEIGAVGVTEIEPADRGARPHRKAFRQLHPDIVLAREQLEQRRLLGILGLRRIARRGTAAAILFGEPRR